MPGKLTFAAVLWLMAVGAIAEPATARYAPAQLRYAEAELDRAEEALANGDPALATRLAAQAELDARLAWSMSDAPHMRRAAAEVSEEADKLRSRALISR